MLARMTELIALLRSDELDAQLCAIQELHKMGPQALPAVVDLLKHVEHADPRVSKGSLEALRQIGASAIHPLDRILLDEHEEEELRYLAAEAIASLGVCSLEHLLHRIRSPDLLVRLAVVGALPRIGSAAATSVPVLERLLGDESLQETAAISLAQIASLEPADSIASSRALRALLDALDRPNLCLRREVVSALSFLGDGISCVLPRLMELARDADEDIRREASYAIEFFRSLGELKVQRKGKG